MSHIIKTDTNILFQVPFLIMNIQIPREVPHPNNNTPIDISKLEDVIIYIVLPLAFVLLFFIGRKRSRRKK
jgi:hypothetical protein